MNSIAKAVACLLTIYPSVVVAAPSVAGVELWGGLRSGFTMDEVRKQRPNSKQEHFSGFGPGLLSSPPQNPNDADSLVDEDIVFDHPTRVEFTFRADHLKDVILTLHDVSNDNAANEETFEKLVLEVNRQYGAAAKCDRTSLLKLGTWISYMCVWVDGNLRVNVLYSNVNRLPVLAVSYHADGASYSDVR
jgi:hypothetical protein